MKRNGGFTLMELLIVIAIIMILAGAIVARIGTSGEKAKKAKVTAELEEISSGCRGFYADIGAWPTNEAAIMGPAADLTAVDNDGAALTGAALAKAIDDWKGPYLEATGDELPKDPWANKYELNSGATSLIAESTHGETVLVHRYE